MFEPGDVVRVYQPAGNYYLPAEVKGIVPGGYTVRFEDGTEDDVFGCDVYPLED